MKKTYTRKQMKKTYTRKQITEAIAHWQKVLEGMNSSSNMKVYDISEDFGVPEFDSLIVITIGFHDGVSNGDSYQFICAAQMIDDVIKFIWNNYIKITDDLYDDNNAVVMTMDEFNKKFESVVCTDLKNKVESELTQIINKSKKDFYEDIKFPNGIGVDFKVNACTGGTSQVFLCGKK